MQPMSAGDAQAFWMAPIIPNDQFVVFGFSADSANDGVQPDGVGPDGVGLEGIATWVRRRAEGVDDLRLRVKPVPGDLDRPYWVQAPVDDDQIRLHRTATEWTQCLHVLGEQMADQLDATRHAWRAHIFGPVTDVMVAGRRHTAVVVALQISHALGDGRRTAGIARELFGPDFRTEAHPRTGHGAARPRAMPAPVFTAVRGAARLPIELAAMLALGVRAFRLERTAAPRPAGGVALTALNRPPGRDRLLRTVTVDRDRLRVCGHSVTVGALLAISMALPEYLGGVEGRCAVELTIARKPQPNVRNNFRNAGVDLHVAEPDLRTRAGLIATEIDTVRRDGDDAARRASRRATAATPAPLQRWGIGKFDPTLRPERVTGVTVVSSVYRGAADLTLDGRTVLMTAGFPALSPAQGLTHGVHGIGDTVTISLTTSTAVCPDIDRYVDILESAIARITAENADCGPDHVRSGASSSAPG